MNASKLFAAVALIASASAFAQSQPARSGEGYQADLSFQSSRTRAEVKAEAAAALRAGQIINGDTYPVQPVASGQGKTRAQVQAEFLQAKALGLVRHED